MAAATVRPLYLPSPSPGPRRRGSRLSFASAAASVRSSNSSTHDVVVVGAGIVGLAVARHILVNTALSVAVVDAGVPCSGATGAGQGYIWMAHRTPGSATWKLAVRSKQMWGELAASIEKDGRNPWDELGWMHTGSLLVARTTEEMAILQEREKVLSENAVRAECLSSSSLRSEEPELCIGKDGGALLLPDDCQIDAFKSVSYIERVNESFISEGRYAELYNDPAISLLRSEKDGSVEGVQTSRHVLYGEKATVIAAGAWTGKLLQSLGEKDNSFNLPIKPRKGHLLVLENVHKMKLNHGIMEVGYIDHQVSAVEATSESSEAVDSLSSEASISMTATFDGNGNLVLGSSRQFAGFCRDINHTIVKSILERAGEFFPKLRSACDVEQIKQIRIGHRPFMPDGTPAIGFIPGIRNAMLATGHEGSGLCLALGTAEIVTNMILETPGKVNSTPFALEHRFSG